MSNIYPIRPKELDLLGDFLSVFDFTNKRETERRVNSLVKMQTEQHISLFPTIEDFQYQYTSDQRKILEQDPISFQHLKEANDCINNRAFKSALSLLNVKATPQIDIKFKSLVHEIIFMAEYKVMNLNYGDLAKSFLTLQSNIENIDTLLTNTKTSNSPIKSLEYKNKTKILSNICKKISIFYGFFPNLEKIDDVIGDEIQRIKANPPDRNDDDSKRIDYIKKLKSLSRKRGSHPWYTREFLRKYDYYNFYDHLTHTKKEEIIAGFISDIQENIYPKWIEDLKAEKRQIQRQKANANRKNKRNAGKVPNETRIRNYFHLNPASNLKACAKALNLDLKTVRKYMKNL